jgi:hypothetical protein
MRKDRILAQDAWYEVRTAINNREKLFLEQRRAKAILFRVLFEAEDLFAFEMRGLALNRARMSFFIKPKDGFQLPEIMQWIKQTFAVRFNKRDGRSGHIWGDRYWSMILEGEPPEGAGKVDWEAVEAEAEPPTPADIRRRKRKLKRVSPHQTGKEAETGISPEIPLRAASPSA